MADPFRGASAPRTRSKGHDDVKIGFGRAQTSTNTRSVGTGDQSEHDVGDSRDLFNRSPPNQRRSSTHDNLRSGSNHISKMSSNPSVEEKQKTSEYTESQSNQVLFGDAGLAQIVEEEEGQRYSDGIVRLSGLTHSKQESMLKDSISRPETGNFDKGGFHSSTTTDHGDNRILTQKPLNKLHTEQRIEESQDDILESRRQYGTQINQHLSGRAKQPKFTPDGGRAKYNFILSNKYVEKEYLAKMIKKEVL